MIVLGDTSGLVAAFNPSDPDHQASRAALVSASATVISPLVMLEIEHIFTRDHSRDRAYLVIDWILKNNSSGRIVVPDLGAHSLGRARQIQGAYRGLMLDLTDAMHVVLSADFQTNAILTIDQRGFRAVTPLSGHGGFHILPTDRPLPRT